MFFIVLYNGFVIFINKIDKYYIIIVTKLYK